MSGLKAIPSGKKRANMSWKKLKHDLDEIQSVIVKIIGILGVLLLLGQALAPRFWEFIKAWKP